MLTSDYENVKMTKVGISSLFRLAIMMYFSRDLQTEVEHFSMQNRAEQVF